MGVSLVERVPMRSQRRRLITPIAVLTGLFGIGAASAHAAGRVSEADAAPAASAAEQAAVPRKAGMELIDTYTGGTEWRSSRLSLPSAEYQAVVSYACDDAGFLYLAWNGENNGYEESHTSAARGTVVLDGKEGGRGYFTVDTWLNCDWTMNVYS